MPANLNYKGNVVGVQGVLTPLHPPAPYIMEDFLVDVLADSPFVTVTQAGTPTTAAAMSAAAGDPVAGVGGWVAGATDDVDAEIDEVSIGGLGTGAGTPWMRADRVGTGMLIIEWAISIPTALTARQYFAGVADDPVEGTGTNGSLNIQSTTTIVDVADDAAGWIFSSLASTPTFWKYGASDSGTQDTATDGPLGVLNTWVGLRTEIDVNGDAFFYQRALRGGSTTAYGKSANGLSPDVLLVPMFTAAPTTTTAVPWEIDYCFAVQGFRP
jgi:hypothetical protein